MAQLDTRNPIEVFVASCLTHYCKCKVPDFHRDITTHLSGDAERLVFEAPRDFAKSTVLSVFYPLFLICCTDVTDIQMFSESGGPGGLSTKWARKMKHEIDTNVVMRSLYGVSRGNAWGQDYFQVKRVGKPPIDVYCRGKHTAARGGRGYVIIDDPQDKDDIRSGVTVERDEAWFYEDVINILEPGQRCIFIGSRLSPLSLLSKVARTPGWKLLSYKAFDVDGHSIWPEKWPDHELRKRRDEIGIDRFNSEFMNEPRISDNPIFREEWLQSYEQDSAAWKDIEAQGLYTTVGVDPAISQRTTADNTAIITVSQTFDKEPRFYIRNVKCFKGTLREVAQQVIMTFTKYQQHRTVVETVGAFKAVADEIREAERIEGMHVNMVEVTPVKDKAARAYAVQGLFQQGRVFVDFTDPVQQRLVDEMLMFTGESTSLFPDDQVDALVYALTEGMLHTERRNTQQGASTTALPEGYGYQHSQVGGSRL